MILGKNIGLGATSESTFIALLHNTATPTLYVSTDLGNSFSTRGSISAMGGTSPRLLAVARDDWNKMVCIRNSVTPDDVAFYSTNGGTNWSAYTLNPDNYLIACAISANGQIMVTAKTHTSEEVYYSTNSGTNWSTDTTAIGLDQPRGIVVKADGSKIYFHSSYTKGVAKYTTNFSSYTSVTAPNTTIVNACGSGDLSYMYSVPLPGVANNVILYKTTNEYSSYSTITVGTISGATVQNASVSCSDNGQYVAMSAYSTYGGNHGRIYVSSDYGVNWTEKVNNSILYTGLEICVSRTGKYMVMPTNVTTNGTFYISTDYGATWTTKTTGYAGAIYTIVIKD